MHVSRRHRPFSGGSRVNVILGEGGYGGHRKSRFKGHLYEVARLAEALGAARHPSVWKLTWRQMHAFEFIQKARRKLERIDLVEAINLATKGDKPAIQKKCEQWAKEADTRLMME